ncbi:MAG: lytic transglycosylase domain-containing protein [Chitinophagaceae bacterium]
MKKIYYIATFCLFLSLAQSAYSRIGEQDKISGSPVTDTAIKEQPDAPVSAQPLLDPKAGFKEILKTAMAGDGVTGARLNPMAVSFVENYIARNRKGYESMKVWGEPYLNLMDQVLQEHGIPKELKYLAVIESGLKANALSPAGALGPWNFMPATARNYGLVVGRSRDERMDYFKSTHAAARMLTDLYSRFNDWLLVIAAYNGGPGNVEKAIRKSGGSRDFWTLQYYLPGESMNHVKKFIATHYIFEGEGGITTITRDETRDLLNRAARLSEDEMNRSAVYLITGRFNAGVIMKHVEMEKEDFERYNPNFSNEIADAGKYNLRLPVQKMNIFISKRYQILDESMVQLLQTSAGQ